MYDCPEKAPHRRAGWLTCVDLEHGREVSHEQPGFLHLDRCSPLHEALRLQAHLRCRLSLE
eukprot:12162862-Alexandrium_andersonii.AAC.1